MTLHPDTYRKLRAIIKPVIDDSRFGLTDSLSNLTELVRKKNVARDYGDATIQEVIRRIRKEEGVIKKAGGAPRYKSDEVPDPEPIFPEYENVNQYFEDFNDGWYKVRKPFELPKKDMKIGVVNDIHIANHARPALMTALEEIKRQGCDTIILNGDIMDCESLGFWRKKPDKNLFKMEVEYGINFLTGLRKMFPKERIIWKDGNHEERVQHDIIDKNPALYELVQLRDMLKLNEFGIEYIEEKQIIKCGELNIIHGHEVRMSAGVVNIARTMFLKVQVNILFGHFHRQAEYISPDLHGKVRGAWAVGCLSDLQPDYNPYANGWAHGFAIVEKQANGLFTVHNNKIINGQIR